MATSKRRRFRIAHEDAADSLFERGFSPLGEGLETAGTVIAAAREQDPLFVGGTIPTPALFERMAQVARARRKGGS